MNDGIALGRPVKTAVCLMLVASMAAVAVPAVSQAVGITTNEITQPKP